MCSQADLAPSQSGRRHQQNIASFGQQGRRAKGQFAICPSYLTDSSAYVRAQTSHPLSCKEPSSSFSPEQSTHSASPSFPFPVCEVQRSRVRVFVPPLHVCWRHRTRPWERWLANH